MSARPAIVLLSGGLDSATCLAIARSRGFACHCLSFRYGQRHLHELTCARRIAAALGAARHVVLDIDLRQFGGSALTSDALPVPKHETVEELAGASDIPVTYVPARNTVFLSFALAMAETTGASDLFIGVNALDYSGYPDCRPEYIAAFERMANLATRAGVEAAAGGGLKIHTPLISLTKGQIIAEGLRLGVDFGLTSTCYDPAPDGRACRHCDACLLRLKGFAENAVADPAPYV